MDQSNNFISNEVFNRLTGAFYKYFFESFVNSKDERSGNVATLLFLAILAYAGVEASKVLFRKNFGVNGISIGRLFLSSIAFIILGIVTYYYYSGFDTETAEMGTQSSFLAASLFYFILAIYIFLKGMLSRKQNALHPNYRGDSSVLGFLMKGKRGWKQSTVQNVAEPLFLLAIGIFLSAVNLWWGIPLVFCAISVWLHLAMEAIMGVGEISELLSNAGYAYSKGQSFSEVVN